MRRATTGGGLATHVSGQLFYWIRAKSHAEHLAHTRWVARPRRVPQAHLIAAHIQEFLRHVPHVPVIHLAAVRARNHDADIAAHSDAPFEGTENDGRQALERI